MDRLHSPLLIDRVPVLAEVEVLVVGAGTAAALPITHRRSAREVPISALQQRLRAAGAVLETHPRPAVTGRDDWAANRL